MFSFPVRRHAGTLAIAGATLALGIAAPPASAVIPTFSESHHVTGSRPGTAAIGRVDADGLRDVLVGNMRGGTMALLRGAAGGALSPAERLTPWLDAEYVGDIDLGDFDADGDQDAIVLDGVLFHVLRNDGNGGFTHAQEGRVGPGTSSAAVGDLDGDGADDAFLTGHDGSGVTANAEAKVLLGQGEGLPLAEKSSETYTAVLYDARLDDVNGDDHLDAVYAERLRTGSSWSTATDGIVVRLGDGHGALGARTLYDAGDQQNTHHPQLIDVTGDGVDDLVAAQTSSGQLTTWPGEGGGVFGAPVQQWLESTVGDTVAADFDGNGKPDLVTAAGYELRIFMDVGPTSYDSSIVLPKSAAYAYSVAAGDVDTDGRDDIIGSFYGDDLEAQDSITFFRNTTGATTPPAKQCADGKDNDGDGKVDLADAGCTTAADDDESDEPAPAKQCEDGEDNDGDGKVDSADAGCTTAGDDDESDDPVVDPPPVLLPFSGFFAPVNNLPTINVATAGRAIPVKFSLGGDRGLDVFAEGYPRSQQVACDSSDVLDGIEETVTAGGSSLTYDAETDRYQYVWKTSDTWSGTCRQLVIKLRDGSAHRAGFRFR